MALTICPTCDNEISPLTAFSTRCSRLVAANPPDLSAIPAELLSDSSQYRFGFRGFLMSAHTMQVVGLFLAAVVPGVRPVEPDGYWRHPSSASDLSAAVHYQAALDRYRRDSRFFAVVIGSASLATLPRPVEYNPGDIFDIEGASIMEELEELMAASDDRVVAWLLMYRNALYHFTVAACGLNALDARMSLT